MGEILAEHGIGRKPAASVSGTPTENPEIRRAVERLNGNSDDTTADLNAVSRGDMIALLTGCRDCEDHPVEISTMALEIAVAEAKALHSLLGNESPEPEALMARSLTARLEAIRSFISGNGSAWSEVVS